MAPDGVHRTCMAGIWMVPGKKNWAGCTDALSFIPLPQAVSPQRDSGQALGLPLRELLLLELPALRGPWS